MNARRRMSQRSHAPIVDMRIRPTFLDDFFGATPGTPQYDVVRWVNRRVGSDDEEHFSRAKDVDAFLRELDDNGIRVGVMVARSVPGVRVSNDKLAEITRVSSERLIGIASVDPVQLGIDSALGEIRRAIRTLGLRGINFDAGFYERPLHADDPLLFPLYRACEELDVPAFIMSGPTTPDLAYNDPVAVDHVATAFPKLSIVCCHAFYPNVDGMIAVAFKHENVYVSPDMYLFMPGAGGYIEAAKGFMRRQLVFGSSYPFKPIRQGIEQALRSDLDDDVLEDVLFRNAARLLKLDLEYEKPTPARSASDTNGSRKTRGAALH